MNLFHPRMNWFPFHMPMVLRYYLCQLHVYIDIPLLNYFATALMVHDSGHYRSTTALDQYWIRMSGFHDFRGENLNRIITKGSWSDSNLFPYLSYHCKTFFFIFLGLFSYLIRSQAAGPQILLSNAEDLDGWILVCAVIGREESRHRQRWFTLLPFLPFLW
jgi:hypothetical protein